MERMRKFSGVSFIRAVITFLRVVLLILNHFQKMSPPNTITLGIRVQHRNLGVPIHSVNNIYLLPDTRKSSMKTLLKDHSNFVQNLQLAKVAFDIFEVLIIRTYFSYNFLFVSVCFLKHTMM
jgi:hypothetical protein